MATMTASASVKFVTVFLMVAFSADFSQAVDNPTGEICNNSKDNITVCQDVKGLKCSNVSMAGSSSSPHTSSSSTPATKSPTTGGTPTSAGRTTSGSSATITSPFIVARPSLQAVALVITVTSFVFFVFSA
ncbi:hypothetical protein SUGI_0302530 [Cryptomeria japonica]|uniref:uncharacterized protein LOC131042281 n=1 Tax=Cryptomeria japonica TaxID=3369 RepID=UPI002408E1B6|nr:uncharacterized protein LOC131042281 [Cryptomeria japonica]GLJ17404.1 hypothetical protein SUGI_0302530 [Cryptomeria japonica]